MNGNGSGKVTINGTEKIDTIQAISNSQLILNGNGTGIVNFGTSGFKFANEVLNMFTSNSFVTAFTIGASSTGNLTIFYQRIGNEVTMWIPAKTYTPATDGLWTSGTIPAIITPATNQLLQVSVGIRNNTQLFIMTMKIIQQEQS